MYNKPRLIYSLLFLSWLCMPIVFSAEKTKEGYTINFDNVNIKEFVRFISKIGKVNFYFDEQELNFNVTIVSEEETSLSNVISALVQVLRIHDMQLLQEGQNYIIHKRSDVKQIPRVVSSQNPLQEGEHPAIITKVFQIENGNPTRMASLISPLLSLQAQVEVSADTRQLIITDTSASINNVSLLLKSIDTVNSTIGMYSYVATSADVVTLAATATDIVKLLATETPTLLIPQPQTNTIFVVSSAAFSDKVLNILAQLDGHQGSAKNLDATNTLNYTIQQGTPESIIKSLKDLIAQAQDQGFDTTSLNRVVEKAQYVARTNSLVFVGTEADLTVIKKFLESIYQAAVASSSFYLFNAGEIPIQELITILHEITDHSAKDGILNPALMNSITNAKVLPQINSMLFVGDAATLNDLKSLLASIQISYNEEIQISGPMRFWIYQIKNAQEEQIRKSLHQLADSLEISNYTDSSLIEAIDSMQWIKSTNSLIFTGHDKALIELQTILPNFDISPDLSKTALNQISPSTNFIAFRPQMVSPLYVVDALHSLAKNLEEAHLASPDLLNTLKSSRLDKTSDQVIITGTPSSLERVNVILTDLDQEHGSTLHQKNTFTVPINFANKSIIENSLNDFARSLPQNDTAVEMIKTMRWLPDSQMLVFQGSAADMNKIRAVIERVDVKASSGTTSTFNVVKLENAKGNVVIEELKSTAKRLSMDGHTPRSLIDTLNSATWNPNSGTILLTGTKGDIDQAKELIATFDIISRDPRSGQATTTFAVVKIINAKGSTVVEELKITAKRLSLDSQTQRSLIDTLNSATWNPNSGTILLTGTKADIDQVKELIANYDVASAPIEGTYTDLYKLEYITPEEAKTLLLGIAEHAIAQGKNDFTKQLSDTIDTIRVVPNTNAIQFVGTPAVNKKIEDWLKTLDTPANAQGRVKQISGTSFFIYQVKNTTPQDLLAHLQMIAKDLTQQVKKAGPNIDSSADIAVINTIEGARVLPPPQNGIVFTGSSAALAKIQSMLSYLDVGGKPQAPREAPEGYQIYSPKQVPGNDLIQYLKHFEQQLVASGVQEQSMSEVIDHLTYVEKTNSIIVSGANSAVQKVMALLERFDVSGGAAPQGEQAIEMIAPDTGFLNYKIQFHNGSDIVEALKAIGQDLKSGKDGKTQTLMEAIQSVQWIPVTNSLIASGEPKILTKVKELIESIDQPLKQVFIEVLVLETHITDLLDFGLRWANHGAYNDQLAWGLGNFPQNDGASSFAAAIPKINGKVGPKGSDIPVVDAGYLGVIGDIITFKGNAYATLGSLLTAIKSDGDITVVLSQKIITQDNRNSKIFVGDNVPFTGSLVTTAGLSQTTNANLEYRNIGVTLSITPFVGNNGVVTLDIDEEISEEENTGSTSGNSVNSQSVNGIRTSKTSMMTRAHVPDRHFLILSGMIRNSTTRLKSGIPCLGGLPLIGAAFSEIQKVTEKKNVIIFVKPHIVDSPQIYEQITRQQELLFGSSSQSNQEDFQAGIEIVRSPDDEEYISND